MLPLDRNYTRRVRRPGVKLIGPVVFAWILLCFGLYAEQIVRLLLRHA